MANLPKNRKADASAMAHTTKPAEEEWLDAVDGVDQSTVDLEGPQYPFIQWVHGDHRLKKAGGVPYTGGWFMNAEQGITLDELPGWEAGELMHEQGGSTEGFFVRDLTVALIRSRRCWRVRSGNKITLYAWNEYNRAAASVPAGGGLSGRLQVLVALRDLEDLGPFVLTMGGSVSRAFSPSRQGDSVMNDFIRSVITPANAANRKRGKKALWPYRAFWLTVGPQRDDDEQPIYTTVGDKGAQATVTLPCALGLHDKMTLNELGELFVGKERLDLFSTWYEEAEQWAHTWDSEQLDGQRVIGGDDAQSDEEDTDDDPAYVKEEDIPF